MNQEIKPRKNLTRFTYENTAFQGWRLAICRNGKSFVKYFSDKQFGSGDAAYEAAEVLLDKILDTLDESKKRYGEITRDAFHEVESYIR